MGLVGVACRKANLQTACKMSLFKVSYKIRFFITVLLLSWEFVILSRIGVVAASAFIHSRLRLLLIWFVLCRYTNISSQKMCGSLLHQSHYRCSQWLLDPAGAEGFIRFWVFFCFGASSGLTPTKFIGCMYTSYVDM
jgi:hypothetical protein